ncbi:MAG: DUF2917 domain-containing protein [Betaproteobacteria bacterium]
MNKPVTDYKARPKTVEIAPRQAITVLGHRGTEIRVQHGQVWITQEGDGEDYIVAGGTRFCSGSEGRIVVSALSEASRISVSWTDPAVVGGYARSGVWLDYGRIAELEVAARRARTIEVARLFRIGFALLKRGWHNLTRRRKPATRLAAR